MISFLGFVLSFCSDQTLNFIASPTIMHQTVSRPSPATSAQQRGLLSFITDSNSYKRAEGRKCYPNMTYGISPDAPAQFRKPNTLVAYKSPPHVQTRPREAKTVEVLSQRNFFSVGCMFGGGHNPEQQFRQQHKKAVSGNKNAFNHQRSEMTTFFERNCWIGSRFEVMGPERTPQALQISQRDALSRKIISRQKPQSKMRTVSTTDFNTRRSNLSHESMNRFLIKQKSMIRESRNKFAEEVKRMHNLQLLQVEREQNSSESKIFSSLSTYRQRSTKL